ncbi:hypothetical protein [Sphingobacterium sp. SYP-B4668]|uniref:hypothetical protein n=1 Tax=Sphingobacterium sp. SYP-B4668 TaxID=2996035 RepID=UPI0005324DE4|nr:hypothetical protein [Sphingobacterium sp. SYP-B4668]
MTERKKGWLSRNLKEIRETLFENSPEDSSFQKKQKAIGWYMFLILMTCGALAMLVAVSFVH